MYKTDVICHSLQQLKASSGHVRLSPQFISVGRFCGLVWCLSWCSPLSAKTEAGGLNSDLICVSLVSDKKNQSPASAIWSWGRWQAKVTDVLSIEGQKLHKSDCVHSLQINNWMKPCFSVLHLGLNLRGNRTVGGNRITGFEPRKPGLRQLGVLLCSRNFVLK